MSSPENRRRFLDLLRASRAAEDAELIAPPTLRAFRGHQGVNQTILAKRISQFSGSRVTQNDISRLECGGSDWTLQLCGIQIFPQPRI